MREKFFNQVYSVIQASSEMGVAHLTTDKNGFFSNKVNIQGNSFTSFSLCDYLDLSHDERLKKGAVEAIMKHGVYTAVSKVYIKLDIYDEAENYVSQIFERPCLLFPRTTLAHIGVLPIITESDDALILDHQVHTSVRIAADLIKGDGTYCETIRHNKMDVLEDRIKELSKKYKKIWYLADSIYSMQGDILPAKDLELLLNKYDNFRLYVDDAHGMSWAGKNGRGYLLSEIDYHPHMVMTTSLGKGFGGGGGVTVCYDKKMKNRIAKCSPPLMFTSPVSPATLGAISESAKIHLSPEIIDRQKELNKRIDYFREISKELELPVINDSQSPIFFIATGKPDMCCEIGCNLMKRGIYINGGVYPAVPFNNSGIRAVLTLSHSLDDIKTMLEALKEEHTIALNKRDITLKDILKHYKNVGVLVEE